jgi:arabinan endo-1,5-alpha-L-arabinosidase
MPPRTRLHAFAAAFSGVAGLVALSVSRLGCSAPSGSSPEGTGGTVASTGGLAATSGGVVSSGGMSTGGVTLATGGITASGGNASSSGGTSGVSTGGAPMGGQGASAGAAAQAGMPAGTGGSTTGGAAGNSSSSGGGAGSGGSGGKGGGGKDSGGSAGVGAVNDLCHRLDAANPPKMLTLSGDLATHDPVVIAADNQFYLFATGGSSGISAKISRNLLAWQAAPTFANPAWVAQQVPAARNLWAPDISYFGGAYHLYYSASSFASNESCIGHATRSSLASGSWTDHGSVICSNAGTTREDWNAIDPNVILDEAGIPWMSFGSFWGGIKLIKLNASGARADTQLLSLAARPAANGALEGPFIVRQCGYYYLFVSFDHCCDSPWDYNIRVGRATSITGPYIDKAGTPMMQGGGTPVVTGNGSVQGPGHNAILVTPTATYNIYHGLNPTNHAASLRIAEMVWDADGWPVSAGP